MNNPFETPETELVSANAPREAALQWREGKILHHPRSADFADRCVKCNRVTTGHRLKRRLYWHSPWLYLLLFQIIIYIIVAVLVRKKADVRIALCEEHRARRRNLMIASVAGTFLGLSACGVGMSDGVYIGAILPGWLFFIMGLVGLIVAERVITPVRIDAKEARIGGVCDAYLAELPDHPSA